ncbi:chemotaxis protein CheB [Gloeobacter violaceus]|uniref:Two-component sensor histidine kinase n=1 Tax=Gloeobacter violaceus (strain ATCC 29082 / PCC 7421) TaxID=251221 RepID=Q7NFG3_GLOVI|nr:chemotaxis protein CheB [Gloeobacter violaceus]BAC91503.1 two-component sensor histidine kinase [Gloeobacter violaceus PCC 7421]
MDVGREPEQQQPGDLDLFAVVGIGASAGGLEAFTQLLSHLPNHTGMAFVLVQHLDPSHRSLLAELLSRTTQLPVVEVHDGMTLEADRVYVIPPNTQMTLARGALQLAPREKVQGRYMPIDAFFRSLAQERGSRAIGVVLSGSDGDGALGLEAIKAAGGITFAQCEASAQFSDMPHRAAATGVDFILPPQAIAEELVKISAHPYVIPARSNMPADEEALPSVFALLQAATGADFTYYKRTTLLRRLRRRMVLHKLERLVDYVRHLQDNPGEVQTLYEEILISVTSFFRDPDVFAALQEKVFAGICQGKAAGSPIRVWVPGCATGEEVYSIAITLLEWLGPQAHETPIQIFGTDISEAAVEKARLGIYKEEAVANVSPGRLRQFFVQVAAGYQIGKSVRELCVFARQNLSSDPPFSNMDLISCRNVLIYLEPTLQKRVLPIFHYSLKPTGFLVLGSSESTGEFTDLFAVVDKKHKIYTRTAAPSRLSFDFVTGDYRLARARRGGLTGEATWAGLNIQQQADRIVLNRYAPAGVLTNDRLEILQFRGETGAYLRPAPGEPSFNLLKMARPGLLPELHTAIYQAKSQEGAVEKAGLRVEGNDGPRHIRIVVIAFKVPPADERYFLVLFETMDPVMPAAPEARHRHDSDQRIDPEPEISRLRQELTIVRQELVHTQAYLQSIIEEQEATNQSLTTANEEILSSNEELQSTNEELQTAKEEIQSANEELRTTNEELQSRNLEARQVNNDLLNLLSNVNIPILMLTNDLRIRRFTPAAQRLFNLIATDVGRSLSDIRLNFHAPDLEESLLEVIDTLSPKEREVQDLEGYWYLLRIRPYRTVDHQIDGVVLALVDIDALKNSAQLLEAARIYAESIVETVRGPLLVLDSDLRVRTANRAFYQTFQTVPAQTEGQRLFELAGGQWDIPRLRLMLENLLLHNAQLLDYEVEHDFENVGRRVMLLNAQEILAPEQDRLILLALEDITEQKRTQQSQQMALQKEYELNELKSRLIAMTSHEFRTPLSTIILSTQLLSSDSPHQSAQKRLKQQQRIERAIEQMTDLLDGILSIGQAEIDQVQIRRVPLDLESFCRQLVEEMQAAPGGAHRPAFESAGQCRGANLDAVMLRQILSNLLTNALKYSAPDSTVRLQLACRDGQAVFTVVDEGIGIAVEDQERLFEPFYRGRNVANIPGSGLGLAIVRRLVELLKGRLAFESRPQQGTTFTVALPLEEPADD